MLKLMKKYTAAFSVTGREWHLAEIIEKDIAPYVDTVTKDALGNLIAFKKGLDSTKRVMVAAHMDEIGFIVTGIDEKGYVRVHNLGGIPATADMYTKVVFENGLRGVLVPDQSTKAGDVTIKKLVIDIGARSRKDAEKKVKIGDVCALECSFVRLMNNRFAAKAFDDRLGCAVAVKAASLVGTPAYDTYYVFTVQEEVGCRGSRTAAFTIAPTFGIAIDVTSTGDTVGASPMEVSLGNGAAIKIKDNSAVCSQLIVDTLAALAEKNKIKYQLEILEFGGTDASSMQTTGAGAYAGCISIPTRYVHTGVETVDLADCKAAASLLASFIESGEKR